MADILVIAEDTAHAVLVSALAREVVREAALTRPALAWIDPDVHLRFRGSRDVGPEFPGMRFTSIIRARQLGAQLATRARFGDGVIRPRAPFLDEPMSGPALRWARSLVATLGEETETADVGELCAVLLASDTDNDPEQFEGVQEAAAMLEGVRGLPFIIATPNRDAEGWFCAGYEPPPDRRDPARLRADAIEGRLGFAPHRQPHRLTGQPNDGPRDAKRILRELLGLGADGRPLTSGELFEHAPKLLGNLARLYERGEEALLRAFVDDLRVRLVRALDPSAQ